jgi:hypothetical protein
MLLLRCDLENETTEAATPAEKARTAKTRTIGIRASKPEYLILQREAYEHNQTLSEWVETKFLALAPRLIVMVFLSTSSLNW